jgi:16S rRNA (guanine966-N2)-methyltransferase
MLISRLGSFDELLVADFFAGSGALGLEALSRGAAEAIFVEQDAAALRAIRDNIASLRAQQRCDVRATSVMALGPAKRAPDLLLLDPPYESGAGAVALDKLRRLGWISPSAWVSVETSNREVIDVKGFEIDTTRDVGKARLHLLRLAEA